MLTMNVTLTSSVPTVNAKRSASTVTSATSINIVEVTISVWRLPQVGKEFSYCKVWRITHGVIDYLKPKCGLFTRGYTSGTVSFGVKNFILFTSNWRMYRTWKIFSVSKIYLFSSEKQRSCDLFA